MDPSSPTSREAGLAALTAEIVACRACPRLVAWREQVAREKRRAAFRDETYWGRPLPGFGDPARACSSSASRRPPTAATAPAGYSPATAPATSSSPRSTAPGFANQPTRRRADDGLELRGALHRRRGPLRAAGEQADARGARHAACPFLAASSPLLAACG